MIYFGEVIFYLLLGLVEFLTITQLSSVSFIILFYVLPVICTLVVSSIKSGNLLTKNILSSVLATIEYLVLGNLFNNMGTWSKFVARNSVSSQGFQTQISNNMLDIPQVIFILVLYFGLGYLIYLVAKRMKGSKK